MLSKDAVTMKEYLASFSGEFSIHDAERELVNLYLKDGKTAELPSAKNGRTATGPIILPGIIIFDFAISANTFFITASELAQWLGTSNGPGGGSPIAWMAELDNADANVYYTVLELDDNMSDKERRSIAEYIYWTWKQDQDGTIESLNLVQDDKIRAEILRIDKEHN